MYLEFSFQRDFDGGHRNFQIIFGSTGLKHFFTWKDITVHPSCFVFFTAPLSSSRAFDQISTVAPTTSRSTDNSCTSATSLRGMLSHASHSTPHTYRLASMLLSWRKIQQIRRASTILMPTSSNLTLSLSLFRNLTISTEPHLRIRGHLVSQNL